MYGNNYSKLMILTVYFKIEIDKQYHFTFIIKRFWVYLTENPITKIHNESNK